MTTLAGLMRLIMHRGVMPSNGCSRCQIAQGACKEHALQALADFLTPFIVSGTLHLLSLNRSDVHQLIKLHAAAIKE